MSNIEKKGYVDPAWPSNIPEGEHPVTEMVSKLAGASSPFGDDTVFPVPYEQTGYVHPYTRINR